LLSKKSDLQEEPVVDWETACFFNCSGHVISNEAVSVNCELERRGGKDSFAFFSVAMCEKAQETRMRIGASGIQTINDIRLQTICCDVWLDRTACLRADGDRRWGPLCSVQSGVTNTLLTCITGTAYAGVEYA